MIQNSQKKLVEQNYILVIKKSIKKIVFKHIHFLDFEITWNPSDIESTNIIIT